MNFDTELCLVDAVVNVVGSVGLRWGVVKGKVGVVSVCDNGAVVA
jgi:hypothetical protein